MRPIFKKCKKKKKYKGLFCFVLTHTKLMIIVQLFKVATRCDVVLCCRVAPLQKAGIVALIKNRTDDMTLAIGDGKFHACFAQFHCQFLTIVHVSLNLVRH